jgi:uncharacterized protein YbbK (DUF523 family)
MNRVLVSACLLGERVRYDGSVLKVDNFILSRWVDENRVISFCPEVAGGLPVPRQPAEIISGDATAVLCGDTNVLDKNGVDISVNFIAGAHRALVAVRAHAIDVAVLKDGSPSCGSTYVYDGTFTGARVAGCGVSVALLKQNDVTVFNEQQFVQAAEYLAHHPKMG